MRRWMIGLLMVLMTGCTTGPLIPIPLSPDEDCSNSRERIHEMKYMTDLYATMVDGRMVLDEEAAREHGFSEKSIVLTREVLVWKDISLEVDEPPEMPPHAQWLADCADESD